MQPDTATAMTEPDFLLYADVARRLRVSEQHVRNLVARGEFPAPVRLGRVLRFERAAVEQWLREQREQAATARTSAVVAGREVQVRG
jgi:excisionase family DNA binding protein